MTKFTISGTFTTIWMNSSVTLLIQISIDWRLRRKTCVDPTLRWCRSCHSTRKPTNRWCFKIYKTSKLLCQHSQVLHHRFWRRKQFHYASSMKHLCALNPQHLFHSPNTISTSSCSLETTSSLAQLYTTQQMLSISTTIVVFMKGYCKSHNNTQCSMCSIDQCKISAV